MFAMSNLRTLVPVFRNTAQDLVAVLDKAIKGGNGAVDSKYLPRPIPSRTCLLQTNTNPVFPLYFKATLDSVGVFALGTQLHTLASSETTTFEECYREMLEPDTIGQILIAINGFIPIRWLPLGPNRRYLHASRTLRNELGGMIKQRIQEVKAAREGKGAPMESRKVKDLLTYMVEKKYFGEDGDAWSEKDLLKQVSISYGYLGSRAVC